MQYIALIHGNTKSVIPGEEWDRFFEVAVQSGMFVGGSEISEREILGQSVDVIPTKGLGGFMRFDSSDRNTLLVLLQSHPVIVHGGTIELWEMPKT